MISPELERMLEPLERFESIRARVARLGGRLADLSYANPYQRPLPSVRAALRETLDDERELDLQYAPFGGQTLGRRAVADALRRTHGLPFEFRDVVLTPGAMSALQIALRTAGAPPQEVVIPTPCWFDFPLYALALGLVPRLVPMTERDCTLDLDAIEGALSDCTCAVLLSQPANPTGHNYGKEVIGRLADLLRRAERTSGSGVTLICDEVHRDFVSNADFATPAAVYDRSAIVYSFGKYHLMQGQRLGYVAVSPMHPERDAVREEMVRWTRVTGLATPTALMQRTLPRLLALRHDHSWVEDWRARFAEELERVGYSVVRSDSTLFMYVRTPAGYLDDFEFASALAARGVLVLPAPVFHHQGHFRLSLTGSERMLEKALSVFREIDRR